MEKVNEYQLPDNLKGRSISIKVIPTVCNLKNMLKKLVEVNGDFSQLKQWEKRSYKAYQIDDVKSSILAAEPYKWRDILREHILGIQPSNLGASVIDIYLVAYVAETIGVGKECFFNYIRENGISAVPNSAQAIWQVGKGDGIYLQILHEDGSVKDWDYIMNWVEIRN